MVAAAHATGQILANEDIIQACYNRVDSSIVYDSSYRTIKYPMGDVPANVGVCTDAVIRVLRDCGIDLQEHVHNAIVADNEDNRGQRYHIKKPNTSIDHRRVWTLKKWFDEKVLYFNEATCGIFMVRGLPTEGLSRYDGGYFPGGTILIYEMWPGQGHIGIVVDSEKNLIFHQVGYGQVIDASMRAWKIVGAYLISPCVTYHYMHASSKEEES